MGVREICTITNWGLVRALFGRKYKENDHSMPSPMIKVEYVNWRRANDRAGLVSRVCELTPLEFRRVLSVGGRWPDYAVCMDLHRSMCLEQVLFQFLQWFGCMLTYCWWLWWCSCIVCAMVINVETGLWAQRGGYHSEISLRVVRLYRLCMRLCVCGLVVQGIPGHSCSLTGSWSYFNWGNWYRLLSVLVGIFTNGVNWN